MGRRHDAVRGTHGLTHAEVHAWVVRSRAAQGLPPQVTDPVILEAVQAIFRAALPPYELPIPPSAAKGAAVTRRPSNTAGLPVDSGKNHGSQ
jgi:hypothetical protein